MNRELNWQTEVLVTQGSAGALESYICALVNKDDEAVMFEPTWNGYQDFVEMAGGKANFIPLVQSGDNWVFNPEELRAALKRPQTKVFILTSPHNPTGKVFTQDEMKVISKILDECPHVITLHDAVYSEFTYDGHKHEWFASMFNNWERTITIISAGPLMNCSAWRIGWAIGP